MALESLNETLKKATMKDMKVKVDNSPKECCPSIESSDETEIPYGLRIDLNEKSLKNLGLTSAMFNIEGQVAVHCQCEVIAIRSSKSDHYDSENVELQIVSMAIAEKE